MDEINNSPPRGEPKSFLELRNLLYFQYFLFGK